MSEIRFEWDENKNQVNITKHKVSFAEAMAVFYDDNALLKDDPDHSENEERFLIIGMSYINKILVVSHCYRCDDEVIRIISARKATKCEARQYNERL